MCPNHATHSCIHDCITSMAFQSLCAQTVPQLGQAAHANLQLRIPRISNILLLVACLPLASRLQPANLPVSCQ